MVRVAMTYATGMGPMPTLLAEQEGRRAVKRVFDAEGIPLALIDNRDHQMPLASLAGLFLRAARATGSARFGLDVGLVMMPGEYGLWARYAMQGATLGDAIGRVARCLGVHQSGTQMRIARRPGGLVAWEYRHPGVSAPAFRHHTDHVVPVMTRFAQGFLGPDWRPLRIEVGYPAPERPADLEDATGVPWVFGRPAQAIVLPAAALLARRPSAPGREPERLLSASDLTIRRCLAAEGTPARQIRAIVSLRLLDGLSDIDGAAQMLRMGRRTLQRHLAEEGLGYRALLNEVRMERARSLIEETDVPLKRICFQLGYTDPAHFARAFVRQFGHPPSALRERVRAG